MGSCGGKRIWCSKTQKVSTMPYNDIYLQYLSVKDRIPAGRGGIGDDRDCDCDSESSGETTASRDFAFCRRDSRSEISCFNSWTPGSSVITAFLGERVLARKRA